MLLDEPFGQLDAQTRYFMEKETARIWEAEKRTILFVINNIDEAVYLADRIVTMVANCWTGWTLSAMSICPGRGSTRTWRF